MTSQISHQQIEHCSTREEFMSVFSAFLANAEKLLIVHGRKSYVACGAKELLENSMNGFSVSEFDSFTDNPKKEDVDAGVALLKRNIPDAIVAVGGGSVLDMAKLIRYYSGSQVPLLAIPTTAGTGAESTQFAVCYIQGVKHSISDSSILPDYVILYPPFTYGNSGYLTACTAFDAFAQAIESYWNINATTDSDDLAIQAIKQIYPVLLKREYSIEDRDSLMSGANAAGKAINITRTTVPHALSYTLTSKYGYPHGHAVALTFPFFLKYNLEGMAENYRGKDYMEYVNKMCRLRKLLNVGVDPFVFMKGFVKQLGLGFDPNRDFDDMIVAQGINIERARNNPIAISKEVILEAVKSIRD